MKMRLLEHVRCPRCRGTLRLETPIVERVARPAPPSLPPCNGQCPFGPLFATAKDCGSCATYEVVAGMLACDGCGTRYAVAEGVPCLRPPADAAADAPVTERTADHFGYLWSQSQATEASGAYAPYHVDHMMRDLQLDGIRGLVLDAGCGEGIDLVNQAQRPDVEMIGVELSDGGCRTSYARSWRLPAASVVQGDLTQLPLGSDQCDFIYSYGVLHHLPVPERGLRELVRVLKPGGRLAIYLYEDFSDRALGWRWLLRAANTLRSVTTRLPAKWLYRACRLASPLIFLLFTVPSRILQRVPGLRPLAESVPFRHAPGPWGLAGDLYDRFSAPVEWRYSCQGAHAFAEHAGLTDICVVWNRGWMVAGQKPGGQPPPGARMEHASSVRSGDPLDPSKAPC